MTPEEIVARLLYRDGLMLIIDKPAGYAVHKGPKGGESLEDHFGALRFGLPRSPALAHRLDRDTSGCLVLGRHRKALATLGKLFKDGRVGKTYWAVVEGGPAEDEGRIDLPLGKRDDTRGWWMKVDPEGQPSATTWKVMGRADDNGKPITWLALEPLTGRTHQLRVHCAATGLADPRRHHLRQRAAHRRACAASARARSRRAALQEQGADPRDGAGAADHAGPALCLRLAGRGVQAGGLSERSAPPYQTLILIQFIDLTK